MGKRRNKVKKIKNFAEIEYIITPGMQQLINGLKATGYKVKIFSGKRLCGGWNGKEYYRYSTEISIDKYDGDGYEYTFDFTPDGERILNYEYDSMYCEYVDEVY